MRRLTASKNASITRIGFFYLSDRYESLDAKKNSLVQIDAVVPRQEFGLVVPKGV